MVRYSLRTMELVGVATFNFPPGRQTQVQHRPYKDYRMD